MESMKTATQTCYSCGEHRTEGQLGTCLSCGARICGMNGCRLACACDDARQELIAGIDEILASREGDASGNVLPPCWDDPEALGEATAILQQIDPLLGASALQTATA